MYFRNGLRKQGGLFVRCPQLHVLLRCCYHHLVEFLVIQNALHPLNESRVVLILKQPAVLKKTDTEDKTKQARTSQKTNPQISRFYTVHRCTSMKADPFKRKMWLTLFSKATRHSSMNSDRDPFSFLMNPSNAVSKSSRYSCGRASAGMGARG